MPAEEIFDAALDGEEPAPMPGALPTHVRIEREQRTAEETGARLVAQQIELSLVNTPQSLPLELLKSL
jgi:hypothetical protein